MSLFSSILMIKRLCQRNEDRIMKELGLSQSEFNSLLVLEKDETLSGTAFAERMVISISRSSRILDRLYKKKMITRQGDPQNRRQIRISLTQKGLKLREEMLSLVRDCEESLLGKLEGDDKRMVIRSLEYLGRIMQEGKDEQG